MARRSLHPSRAGSRRLAGAVVFFAVSLLSAGVIQGVTPASASGSTTSAPAGLVLWNTLGSTDEVLHSAVGPNLGFYANSDCFPGLFPGLCFSPFIDIPGNPAYVPGLFGNAVTIGDGPYFSEAREHTLVLRNAQTVVNPERGTIEAWYQERAVPVGFVNGVYRVFDGAYGIGNRIGLYEEIPSGGPRVQFSLAFGPAPVVLARSKVDGQPGADMSPYHRKWIHLTALWDRDGIAGTSDSMRLYIDGKLVASNSENDWGTTAPLVVDIAGGNDGNIARTFFVDDLKLWNFAKAPPAVLPTTTALLTPAANAAGWNRTDETATLTATDQAGPGVKEISYAGSGSQQIPSTTQVGNTASLSITAEGTTTVTYLATDLDGNQGQPRTLAVNIDKTRPNCTLTGSGTDGTGHTYIRITVQDPRSGLGSVQVTETNNATVPVPAFAAGITTPVVVTATKLDQTHTSQVVLNVTDRAGNVTSCDPILTEIGRDGPGGVPRSETFRHVAQGESHITVLNNTPGLDRLKLVVNGHVFEVGGLADGEKRDLDVSAAMRRGNNTITITAQGGDNGTAAILIADR
jgi:hypothetical protein